MFDFLKKKISGFIEGITKKEEEKAPEAKQTIEEKPRDEETIEREAEPEIEPAQIPIAEEKEEETVQAIAEEKIPEPEKKEAPAPKKIERTPSSPKIEKARAPIIEKEKPKERESGKVEKKIIEPEIKKIEPKKPEARGEAKTEKKEQKPAPKEITIQKPPEPKIEKRAEPKKEIARERTEEEKPKERIKLGLVGAVKSFITREVEITEKDVKDMVDSLELELLEADVDISVAEGIKNELMEKLVGSKIEKEKLHAFVSGSIKETLIDVLSNEKSFDILDRLEASEKPLKIVFLGINGAGKTTTIAKVAKLLQDNNKKLVFAAADTFRAAAIEQMGVHADKLGVKMIKREYGSDPTSVAYDAVNYAKAHSMDAVLIDTAGRQDTNISLINEMKKMDRVIEPDLKIYIGESIAGNAIIEQISAFDREIGLDAVILTKLDCDPKGGTMLSINKATGVPIIYVGVGQGYDALERFDPKKIAERIVE